MYLECGESTWSNSTRAMALTLSVSQ